MAGLLTKVQIERIHRRRLAKEGTIYEDVNRVKYVGNAQGYLEKEEVLSGDTTGTTLENSNDNIAGRNVEATSEKGQILVDSGNGIVPLSPGEDGEVLTADSNAVGGMSWQPNASDKHFVFEQGVAAATWVIQHNLNKKPSVMVVDSGDNVVEGCEIYIDNNNMEIQFSAPFSGKAYLN